MNAPCDATFNFPPQSSLLLTFEYVLKKAKNIFNYYGKFIYLFNGWDCFKCPQK